MINVRLIQSGAALEFSIPDKWFFVHDSGGSIELFVFGSRSNEFDWGRLALVVPSRYEQSEILIDHHSLETMFPIVTNMLHRFMWGRQKISYDLLMETLDLYNFWGTQWDTAIAMGVTAYTIWNRLSVLEGQKGKLLKRNERGHRLPELNDAGKKLLKEWRNG